MDVGGRVSIGALGRRGQKGERTHLSALIWTHCYVAVCATCEAGVDAGAEGGFALFAVAAAAVGDVEGEDDPVALLEEGDAAADLDDDAHVFMSSMRSL